MTKDKLAVETFHRYAKRLGISAGVSGTEE